MKEQALVPVGHTNKLGHVAGGQSFEVAQHDDLALAVWQLGQELLHAGGEVLGDEAVVDPVGPRLRRCRPCAELVEAVLDDALIWASRPLFSVSRSAGAVEQDVKQPRLERGPTFEPLESAHYCYPGVLGDLLGHGATADRRLGQAQHPRLVAADERDECRLVTGPTAVDQLDVLVPPRQVRTVAVGMDDSYGELNCWRRCRA